MTDVIRDLPTDERPRERMFRHGPDTLSNSEIVAILLGSGVPGKNAIQLARELLHDGIEGLSERDIAVLAKHHGVGTAKASRVVAAFELARRMSSPHHREEPPDYDVDILGRKLVSKYSRTAQERLGGVFLNTRHAIVGTHDIYLGTIGTALVSTRDIIRYCMEDGAVAVVLYHNHPSGNVCPSDDDLEFTKKLKHSLSFCDLELHDHLIIGPHSYYSMKAKGYV